MHDHILRKACTKSRTDVTSSLRTMLNKEVEFKLQKPQLDANGKLKLLVTTTPCLKIFNPNLRTKLKIDLSSEGLGAFLEENYGILTCRRWCPVVYTLRPLSCVEKFHEFIFGRKFTVSNDNQPLKSIFTKSIVIFLPRIQKFFYFYKNMNLI